MRRGQGQKERVLPGRGLRLRAFARGNSAFRIRACPWKHEQAFKRCCQLCAPACMPSQIRSPDAHPAAGIAIGGDAFPGSTLSDHCLRYQHIPQVRLQVLRMCPVYAERRLGWVGSWLAGLAVPARAAGGAEGGQSLWCLQRMAGR